MKKIELTTATKSLADYAKDIGGEVIVLTSHQKPIAAIVSLENVDQETLALSTNPEFMEILQQARAEFAAGKKLSLDEMKRQFPD